MAFSSAGSAIDDSFDPTFFQAQSRRAGSSHGSDGPGNFNGPRSGHWTVGSTVGSAIDDRCPTIWGSSAGKQDCAQTQAHVQPIAGSLLRKLGKASLERQSALEAERTTYETVKAEASQWAHVPATVPTTKQDTRPKGFYLPRLKDARGVDIAKKSSQDKPVRQAQWQYELSKSNAPDDSPKGRATTSQVFQKPEKATSHASEVCEPNTRMVRIIGKDGQEAFFELPILPKPISRPASVVADIQTPKAAMETISTTPAKGVKLQKTKQERRAEQRAAAADMAARIMMSGALPPSEAKQPGRDAIAVEVIPWKTPTGKAKVPVVKAVSVASSTKDSGVEFDNLFAANASVVSAQPSKAPSAKSLQAAVQSISKNSKTPSNHSFQGAGEDWVNASGGKSAAYSHHSRPASAAVDKSESHTSEHYIHSMAGFDEAKPPSVYAASAIGNERPASEKQVRNGNSPTVFAGRGWISPHPLSRSPSAFASPPQSHISLPKELDFPGGGQMTYDEWQAMPPPEPVQRRNYSRTESVMSHRVQAVAASIAIRNGSHATALASVVGSRTYHQPTMESEHEHNSQSSGSQVPQHQKVRSAGAGSASARSGNLKSASKHSGQTAHWSSAHSQRSNAKGWDALPHFDGACDEHPTRSEHATAVYKKQLQSIIAQSSSPEANYRPLADDARDQPHEVQINMPWDKSYTSRTSSRTQSRGSLQRSIIEDTPPSAAGYSPVLSARGRHEFHGSHTGGSSRNPASSSLRMYDGSGSVRSVDGDEPSVLSSGSRVLSGGVGDIDRAERGYGGY